MRSALLWVVLPVAVAAWVVDWLGCLAARRRRPRLSYVAWWCDAWLVAALNRALGRPFGDRYPRPRRGEPARWRIGPLDPI